MVSRIVKYLGMTGVLLALPLVALGGYALIAAGAGFAIVRWAKTAENATDYSVMNTGTPDAVAAHAARGEVQGQAGRWTRSSCARATCSPRRSCSRAPRWLALGAPGFALVNLALVVAWLGVVALVIRRHRELSARESPDAPPPPEAAGA